jgi:RNA polymerase primary sigma factor
MSVDSAATASPPTGAPPGRPFAPRRSESHPSPAPASNGTARALDEATMLRQARAGHDDARAQLVDAFTPLIGSVARTYRHVPGIDRPELMQEGVVGMLRALGRFDPDLGIPFWAYASWWVRQAMQQLVAELSRPVVLSDRALRQLAHVRDARRRFLRTHSREPSLSELAHDSELTMVQLQRLIVAERQPRGLEERVDETSRAGATFGDLLCDPTAEQAYEEMATRLGAAEVPRLLDGLSGRERGVIEARYGLNGPERTLRELGQRMGVSAERVRQIEQSALEKMRAASSSTTPPRASRRDCAARTRTRPTIRPPLVSAPLSG